MQQTDRIDVLTTLLAATDRRALSQAWYSALHVAENAPGARAGRTGASQLLARNETRQRDSRASRLPAHRGEATGGALAARSAERRSGAAVPGGERRAPKTALARRVERVLVQPRDRMPSSLSLSTAAGRVHLLIRNDGSRTRLVALCAPSLRERVERALAEVRFALAGRGLTAEVA